jgi:hypothetical protein
LSAIEFSQRGLDKTKPRFFIFENVLALADVNAFREIKSRMRTFAILILTRQIFTRNGQTILMRDTTTKSGAVWTRVHTFYYRGVAVGEFLAAPDSSRVISEGSPYWLDVGFTPTNASYAVIGITNGPVVAAFMATNGLFYPYDSPHIPKEKHDEDK